MRSTRQVAYAELASAIWNASYDITHLWRSGEVDPELARQVIGAFVDNLAERLRETNQDFDADLFLEGCGHPRPHPTELDAKVQAMKKLYEGGASLADVGGQFDVAATTVAKRLRAIGVEIRKPRRRGPRHASTGEQEG